MLPIPIRTENRLSRRPWVNYAILFINVAVFLVGFRGGNRAITPHLLDPFGPALSQYFTSMFLHAGLMHLGGNMLFLWVFGNAVNDRFGHVGYAAFYLTGGVLAGLGYMVMGGQAPVLGASGAIAGVTGCYLVLFPRVRVTVLWWMIIIIPMEVPSLYLIGVYFVYDLLMTLTGTGGQVAVAAHLTGYLYGFAIAMGLLGVSLLPRDVYDLLSLLKAHRRRAGYRRMVQGGYNPYGHSSALRRSPNARPIEARTVESTPRTDTPSAEVLRLRQEIARTHGLGDFSQAADRYLELVGQAEDVVLPRQQQLDVANQLMSEQRYPQAADAYERLLRHYPQYEHLGDIQLMLGIIYGRYLGQAAKAREHLSRALQGLHDQRKVALARSELAALGG